MLGSPYFRKLPTGDAFEGRPSEEVRIHRGSLGGMDKKTEAATNSGFVLGFLTWDGWRLNHLGCFRVWACGTPGFSKKGASYKSQDTGKLRRDFPNELWRDSHKKNAADGKLHNPSIATSNQVP